MVLLHSMALAEESKYSKVELLRMEQKMNHFFGFELQKTQEGYL